MAAIPQTPFIGANDLGLTSEQLETLRRHAAELGYVDLTMFLQYAARMMMLPFFLAASIAADATGHSIAWVAPFPGRVLAFFPGCQGAAGATGTINMMKAPAADPTTYASILPSGTARDVKTAAGIASNAAPDAASYTFEVGDRLRITGISGSGGALTGGMAWVLVQRD